MPDQTETNPLVQGNRTYFADESREFLEFAQVLNGIDIAPGQHGVAKLVGPDGKSHEIPDELFLVLVDTATHLAHGDGVTIMPNSAQLTTQQAADFLGLSRPTLVKLLEADEIPFTTVGRHRRVALNDVVAYQGMARIKRRQVLSALAKGSADEAELSSTPELKRLAEME